MPRAADDTLHGRFIEALARRADAATGAERALLQTRLAQWREAEARRRQGCEPTTPPAPGPSPLTGLLHHIAQQADASAGTPPELKSLRLFRSTWTRLGAEQRLTQSQARLPDNAGPLHSQRLVHRALTAMRELSPAYLEHFIAQVDALLWLDQVNGGDMWTKKDVLLAEGGRKPVRDATRKSGKNRR